MWTNPQFPADLVTFTEEILNGKIHFLCSGWYKAFIQIEGMVLLVGIKYCCDSPLKTMLF